MAIPKRAARRGPGRPCLAELYTVGVKREHGLRLAQYNLRPITTHPDTPWRPVTEPPASFLGPRVVEATVVKWMLNHYLARSFVHGGVELTREGLSLLGSLKRRARNRE